MVTHVAYSSKATSSSFGWVTDYLDRIYVYP
jgi:hypothetical protein